MIISKTHKDLKDVLMEPKGGAKEAYYLIKEDDQNITILSPGKAGMEFNKTHGYFHQLKQVELLVCLYGQGLLVMQRNDETGEAKEFKIVTLHPGKQVAIPIGFGHTIINIGRTFLVTLDNGEDKSVDNKELKEKHGFAYYVVEKKGEVGFETNPFYKVHPQITSE